MKKVTGLKTLPEYRLDLTFDDGVNGIVDLSHLVGKGVFESWRDPSFFEQVRIGTQGELLWGDLIDLCPDALFLKATGKSPEDIFPALSRQHTHA